MTTRRGLIMGMGVAALVSPDMVLAQAEERLPLWPDVPMGAPSPLPVPRFDQKSNDPRLQIRWLSGIDRPWLAVRRPVKPNGAAAIVIPGGGYRFLSWDREGEAVAGWLNGLGVTVFILAHRLPGEGWRDRATVPLADAQRAMRQVRWQAANYAVDPTRVAVIGFSAGGHLAGSLATRHAEPVYAPIDAADRLSARPDLAGLVYPVVSMVEPFTHAGSRDTLLGPDASFAARRSASIETRVSADMPPALLIHAGDDSAVPPANSLAVYHAIRAAGRPAALHLFEDGGHGFGLHLPPERPAASWPGLFTAFAASHGLFPISKG